MQGRLTATGLLALVLSCAGPAMAAPVNVAVFAINDLHGNLDPPAGGISIPDPDHPGMQIAVAAGGVEHMATMIRQLRARHHHSIFVAAGDLVGASPLLSNMFHDEPTIRAMSLMGLEASAVGNHEFDKGVPELLRLQKLARFQYLAASTVYAATGKTILPPYYVKRFEGIPVAFIGLTLADTPEHVMSSSVAGLEFRDEAQTINRLVPKLRAQGIEAIVVLIHQGGYPKGGYNDCAGFEGPIIDIVKKLDKAVDVVVSGHTHRAYNCVIDGRVVTSADRYGTVVTEIDLKLDRKTHDVISAKAENRVVRDDLYPSDPAEARLLAHYRKLAAPIAGRIVGAVSAPITTTRSPAGEAPLGDLIADAERATGDHAQLALMNAGGIRGAIMKAGGVSHADLFTILPFANLVVTMDLTGDQIKSVMERQWAPGSSTGVYQVSDGFSYRWDDAHPAGDKVIADSMMLDGAPMKPDQHYRVAVPDFMADGGGGLDVLRTGTNRVVGKSLLEGLEDYLAAHSPFTPAPTGRISRVN